MMCEWKRLTELSDCYRAGGGEVQEMIELFEARIQHVRKWVDELQAGMYINCVYCGHRYGPREDTPVAMADVLREHIEQCPEHPLSKAKDEIERLRGMMEQTVDGELLLDCEALFCPHCANEVDRDFDWMMAACNTCTNPDDGQAESNERLPLAFTSCYSTKAAAIAAKRN